MRRYIASILPLLLVPCLAAAECRPIDQLPAEIHAPGCHQLVVSTQLLLKNDAAIRIFADNVVLDLGGHVIENLAGTSNTSYGVVAVERSNVVVRNGSIRGFQTGVGLGMATPDGRRFGGYTVENIQLYGSTLFGIDLRGFGLSARGNRVVFTGGTRQPGREGEATAIYAQGNLVSIVDNDVLGTIGNAETTHGIVVAQGNAAVVERNRVLSTGIGAVIARGASSGTCRDNTFGEIAIASYDCPIDGGGNVGEIRLP